MTVHAIASDSEGTIFVVRDEGNVVTYEPSQLRQFLRYVEKRMAATAFAFADSYDEALLRLLEQDRFAELPLRLITPHRDLDVPGNLAARLVVAALFLASDSSEKARLALRLAREARFLDDDTTKRHLQRKPHIRTLINILTL